MTVLQLLSEEYVSEMQIFVQLGAFLWGTTAAFVSSS